jgi:hypothetical protein
VHAIREQVSSLNPTLCLAGASVQTGTQVDPMLLAQLPRIYLGLAGLQGGPVNAKALAATVEPIMPLS